MQLFHWCKWKMFNSRRRGQGIVEFALVLPVFLILLLGIMEFGRLFFLYAAVQTASREGSRFGAATENLGNCGNIRDAVTRLAFLTGMNESNIGIKYDNGSSTFGIADCQVVPADRCDSYSTSNDRIVVQVVLQYNPIIPIPGISGVCFESKSARTILNAIQVVTPSP